MATIEGYQAPNNLLRPEAQGKEDRDSQRLDQLEKAAEDNVHHFDRFLGIGSGEESLMRFGLARQIRNRVFDVIEDATDTYADTVGTAPGEFSRVESFVWDQRRDGTLNAIHQRGRGARNASKQVVEGFEPIIEKAIGAFTSQLDAAESAAEARLDARNGWEKMWGLRQKKRLAKFSAACRKHIEKEQTRLSAAINVVKQTKEIDVTRAENRIQMMYSNADDTTKTILWARIHAAIQEPLLNAPAAARLFGYRDVSDFMEAVQSLDFIDGAINSRVSTQKGIDAREKLSRLSNRERRMDTVTPDYRSIQDELTLLSLKPSDKKNIPTEDMANAIEKELIGQGVNLLEDVYRGNQVESPSGAEKIMFFAAFLNANPGNLGRLGNEVQRDLLKYLNDFETESQSGYEDVDTEVLRAQDTNLREVTVDANRITNGPVPNLTDLQYLQITAGAPHALDNSDISQVLSNATNWCDLFGRRKATFEAQKANLDEEHRTQFEEQWAVLQRFFDKLQPQIERWRQERKAWEQWNDKQTVYTAEFARLGGEITMEQARLATAQTALTNPPLATTADAISREMLARQEVVNQRMGRLQKLQDTQAGLTHPSARSPEFTHPNEFDATFREMGNVFNAFNTNTTPWYAGLARTAPGPNPATFNRRLQEKLKKEFQEDAEKRYLEFLEKNTEEQWKMLNENIPTGALVRLDFRDTTNVDTLQFPRDLDRKRETRHHLRVIRKNENGIMLEDDRNIYVITGPSAKSGVAKTNVAQYEKVDDRGRPIRGGMRTTPLDFSIPENNPNSVGIALNMSIAA